MNVGKRISKAVTETWNYLKPSWEGSDGKFSYRRASNFVILVLVCFMVICGMTLSKWGFNTFLVLCLLFLLLAGLITADQIIKGIKGIGGFSSTVEQVIEKEITDTGDKKTVTTKTDVTPKDSGEGLETG